MTGLHDLRDLVPENVLFGMIHATDLRVAEIANSPFYDSEIGETLTRLHLQHKTHAHEPVVCMPESDRAHVLHWFEQRKSWIR